MVQTEPRRTIERTESTGEIRGETVLTLFFACDAAWKRGFKVHAGRGGKRCVQKAEAAKNALCCTVRAWLICAQAKVAHLVFAFSFWLWEGKFRHI